MAFSQNAISDVTIQTVGPDLLIRWNATASPATMFQAYVDHRLVWHGMSRSCQAPIPAGRAGRNVWVDVGTVAPEEAQQDFSSNLMSLSRGGAMATLTWQGGSYLDPSGQDGVQGFHVYQSDAPGGPINRSKPVDEVPAYPGGWVSDGFGLGGFGSGGFGRSASTYVWSSGSLPGGNWGFTVIPFDQAGNERGNGQSTTVKIIAAPQPPARLADGSRLIYSYSGPSTRLVTLHWSASPTSTA